MADMALPKAFDGSDEPHRFLARIKKRASKSFRLTSAACLSNATDLAFYCHVLGRDEEALEVCRVLARHQFAGNFNLWSPVERALCLQARLCRQQSHGPEAAECLRRVHEAGFVKSRLEGCLLPTENVDRAAEAGDKTAERDWRLVLLQEQCFLIELGGSAVCPVASLQEAYQQNLARLRALVG